MGLSFDESGDGSQFMPADDTHHVWKPTGQIIGGRWPRFGFEVKALRNERSDEQARRLLELARARDAKGLQQLMEFGNGQCEVYRGKADVTLVARGSALFASVEWHDGRPRSKYIFSSEEMDVPMSSLAGTWQNCSPEASEEDIEQNFLCLDDSGVGEGVLMGSTCRCQVENRSVLDLDHIGLDGEEQRTSLQLNTAKPGLMLVRSQLPGDCSAFFFALGPKSRFRVALMSDGTRGDVQPLVLLARRLQALRHTVRAFVSLNLVGLATDWGVEATAVFRDLRELFRGESSHLDQSVGAEPGEALREFKPDLVVWNCPSSYPVADHYEEVTGVPAVLARCDDITAPEPWAARRPHRPAFSTTSPRLSKGADAVKVSGAGFGELNGTYYKVDKARYDHVDGSGARLWFTEANATWNLGNPDKSQGKAAYVRKVKPFEGGALLGGIWRYGDDGMGLPPMPVIQVAEPIGPRGLLQTGAWLPHDDVDPSEIVRAELPAVLEEELLAFIDAGPPPVAVGWGSMLGWAAGGMSTLAMLNVALRALRLGGHRAVVVGGWARLQDAYSEGLADAAGIGRRGDRELFEDPLYNCLTCNKAFMAVAGGMFTEVACKIATASRQLQEVVSRRRRVELREFAERHCFFVAAAPHHWLLPRCSCAIHHGGAGTTQATLYAGKPAVITPLCFEQHRWSETVSRLGVGVGFQKPLKEISPAELNDAIAKAEALAPAADALGRDLREEGGVAKAAEVLDDFLRQEVGSGRWRQRFQAIYASRAA